MKLHDLAESLSRALPLLRCPRCGAPLRIEREQSLLCASGHCYDLSAKGYVNLAPSRDQSAEKYDAQLFASRSRVLEAGFYQPLLDALLSELAGAETILDAGCGEGYYARRIASAMPDACVVGLDLSRDAILAAARQSRRPTWLVADLTRLPLADASVDAIVDVLTPAGYSEFERVLKPDGLLLKAIPANDYLCEIRQAVADRLRSASFSNERVVEHLQANMDVLRRHSVSRTLPLTAEQSEDFLRMTPMTFGLPPETLADIRLERITVAMELLVCRRKP